MPCVPSLSPKGAVLFPGRTAPPLLAMSQSELLRRCKVKRAPANMRRALLMLAVIMLALLMARWSGIAFSLGCQRGTKAVLFTIGHATQFNGESTLHQLTPEVATRHSAAPTLLPLATNNIGPSLAGLFGRKAGTIANFRYSPAMQRSGITWTPQMLDDFIADPQKLVPANRRPCSGMPNPADRADLITYLEKATK